MIEDTCWLSHFIIYNNLVSKKTISLNVIEIARVIHCSYCYRKGQWKVRAGVTIYNDCKKL